MKRVQQKVAAPAPIKSFKWLSSEPGAGGNRLRINEAESAAMFSALAADNVNIISIFGRARQGKSFLMNTLSGEREVFRVSNEKDSCTQGIDISNKWISVDEFSSIDGGRPVVGGRTKVGFVDAEGQGDKNVSYDSTLVCPILLLSKCVIFNWKGDLQKDHLLETLGIMTLAAKNVSNDAQFAAAAATAAAVGRAKFSHLHIVFRDWQAVGSNADSVYDALFNAEGSAESETRDRIRREVLSSFASVQVWLLDAPTDSVKALKTRLTLDVCSEKFRSQVRTLRSVLTAQLQEPTLISGVALTGRNIGAVISNITDSLNRGEVVLPHSAFVNMLGEEVSRLCTTHVEELEAAKASLLADLHNAAKSAQSDSKKRSASSSIDLPSMPAKRQAAPASAPPHIPTTSPSRLKAKTITQPRSAFGSSAPPVSPGRKVSTPASPRNLAGGSASFSRVGTPTKSRPASSSTSSSSTSSSSSSVVTGGAAAESKSSDEASESSRMFPSEAAAMHSLHEHFRALTLRFEAELTAIIGSVNGAFARDIVEKAHQRVSSSQGVIAERFLMEYQGIFRDWLLFARQRAEAEVDTCLSEAAEFCEMFEGDESLALFLAELKSRSVALVTGDGRFEGHLVEDAVTTLGRYVDSRSHSFAETVQRRAAEREARKKEFLSVIDAAATRVMDDMPKILTELIKSHAAGLNREVFEDAMNAQYHEQLKVLVNSAQATGLNEEEVEEHFEGRCKQFNSLLKAAYADARKQSIRRGVGIAEHQLDADIRDLSDRLLNSTADLIDDEDIRRVQSEYEDRATNHAMSLIYGWQLTDGEQNEAVYVPLQRQITAAFSQLREAVGAERRVREAEARNQRLEQERLQKEAELRRIEEAARVKEEENRALAKRIAETERRRAEMKRREEEMEEERRTKEEDLVAAAARVAAIEASKWKEQTAIVPSKGKRRQPIAPPQPEEDVGEEEEEEEQNVSLAQDEAMDVVDQAEEEEEEEEEVVVPTKRKQGSSRNSDIGFKKAKEFIDSHTTSTAGSKARGRRASVGAAAAHEALVESIAAPETKARGGRRSSISSVPASAPAPTPAPAPAPVPVPAPAPTPALNAVELAKERQRLDREQRKADRVGTLKESKKK